MKTLTYVITSDAADLIAEEINAVIRYAYEVEPIQVLGEGDNEAVGFTVTVKLNEEDGIEKDNVLRAEILEIGASEQVDIELAVNNETSAIVGKKVAVGEYVTFLVNDNEVKFEAVTKITTDLVNFPAIISSPTCIKVSLKFNGGNDIFPCILSVEEGENDKPRIVIGKDLIPLYNIIMGEEEYNDKTLSTEQLNIQDCVS